MSTDSTRIFENLLAATEDLLNAEQMLRLSGNGTEGYGGIDANNRLIWGQVFLWPEANGDWRKLWDDSQVFETWNSYQQFKESWESHQRVVKKTVVGGS